MSGGLVIPMMWGKWVYLEEDVSFLERVPWECNTLLIVPYILPVYYNERKEE